MKSKKLLLWFWQAIVLLILTFTALLAVNYFFAPAWLTDNFALGLLTLEIIIFASICIIKLMSHHTATEKHIYTQPTDNGIPSQHHRKAHIIPVSVCVSAAFLVVITSFGGYRLLNQNKLNNIPEDIIEFGEKYPEAQEYVENFNKYVNTDFNMDVSKEMSRADIPLFIQWDKRWGYKNYGENYIGVAGCGPACLAMVVCGLKNDPEINPYAVASYASEQGFYTYGQGTSWLLMTEGADHYGLEVTEGRVSSDFILENLSSRTPMICSMGPGDFTTSGHFIVLTEIDSDGKIIVNDPNSPDNSSRHWDVDTLVSQMTHIWEYSNS